MLKKTNFLPQYFEKDIMLIESVDLLQIMEVAVRFKLQQQYFSSL